MIPQKLNLSRTVFSTPKYAAFAVVLLSITSLTLCRSTSGQNLQSGPVARLTTAPESVAYSRPRRVSLLASSDSSDANAAGLPSINDATSIERRAFDRTNEVRAQNGLTRLAWDADLCRMARVHAESMATLGFFAHETPDGFRLKDRARAMGILRFKVLGENIAYNQGYEDPGAFAVERWMISPGHRANILYRGFQASAIGSFVASDGSVYLAQVFITR